MDYYEFELDDTPKRKNTRLSKEDGFFVQVPKAFIYDRRLSESAKMLMLYMVDRCGGDDSTWVCTKTIMRDTGYGRTKIHELLTELKSIGFVDIQKLPGSNRNDYFVKHLFDCYSQDERLRDWNYYFWLNDPEGYDRMCLKKGKINTFKESQKLTTDRVCEHPNSQIRTTNVRVCEHPNIKEEQVEEDQYKDLDLETSNEVSEVKSTINPASLIGAFGSKVNRDTLVAESQRKTKEEKKKVKDEQLFARKQEIAQKLEKCPEGVDRHVWEEGVCVRQLERLYSECMARYGFGSTPRLNIKEKAMVKSYWRKCGSLDNAKKVMEYVIKNWSQLRIKHKNLNETPGVLLFASQWVNVFYPLAIGGGPVNLVDTDVEDKKWENGGGW